MNFVYFINFWTREQACKHAERTTNVINGHYMLASPSIKQIVSNKCHKRERQVNQSHASGSDNVNGAEEVYIVTTLTGCNSPWQVNNCLRQSVDVQIAEAI